MPKSRRHQMRQRLAISSVLLLAVGVAGLQLLPHLPWWWSELVSHFRAFYLMLGLVFGFCLLLLHWRVTVIPTKYWLLYLVTTASLAWPLLRFLPSPQTVAATNQSASLQIMSANIYHSNTDIAPVLAGIQQSQPDVLALLEMPVDKVAELAEALGPEYRIAVSHPGPATESAYALSLVTKSHIESSVQVTSFDGLTPVLDVTLAQPQLRLLVLHPPPPITELATAWRNQTLLTAAQQARDSQIPTIVMGDLNISPFAPMFDKMLNLGQLTDPRLHHGLLASWTTTLPGAMRIPIDHILIPKEVGLNNLKVGPNLGSDHLPISARVWRVD